MSGGSYNYLYSQIEDEYVGRMYDIELNDMMKDLTKLLKNFRMVAKRRLGRGRLSKNSCRI